MSGYRVRSIKPIQVGYKRGRLSTTTPALSVTAAYRAGCDRMGWGAGEKAAARGFCKCGRLPAWCECIQTKQQETHG